MTALTLTKGSPPTVHTRANVEQYLHDQLPGTVVPDPTAAGEMAIATAANTWSVQQPLRIVSISGIVADAVVKIKAPFPGTITEAQDVLDSGSFDYSVAIAGTDVTGIAGISVSLTTETTRTATGANTFTAGQTLTLTVTNSATPVNGTVFIRVTQTGIWA